MRGNLDSSVERAAGEGVVVLGVDDDLHDVVRVTLKHLCTDPLLIPVPQLDQHVICTSTSHMMLVNVHINHQSINQSINQSKHICKVP